MSRADEIAQGLREPSGELIGGLYVEDYVQGIRDFETGATPPRFTSTSYDLGRARARDDADRRDDMLAKLRAAELRRRDVIRGLIAHKPDVLAEFNAKMAELDAKHS